MTSGELLSNLLQARTLVEAQEALDAYLEEHSEQLEWTPFGRKNNRGTIEAAGDTGRSLVERATNGIDAVLELEHTLHNGQPRCESPKQAAAAWLGVPDRGLSAMSPAQRRQLAQRVVLRLEPGESRDSRIVTVQDKGIGIQPDRMPSTILSLSEDNKLQKHYLAGTFGQGGSSTLATCKLCLIASRFGEGGLVGFTVAKYLDLPPDQYKTGHYVYLTQGQEVLTAQGFPLDAMPAGTMCRHFGYDLDSYPSPLGPNSVYGLLNTVLFDPVIPIWFENSVHNYNRVIKGSRNALNGAVDEGDDGRGPTLSHSMPQFFIDLGDVGRVGIEYWVLEAPTRQNKRPSAAFVNEKRPIILTSNGQNHAELSAIHIRKDADLPFLAHRLICHIDCDQLEPASKRSLFVSNREEARRGVVRNLLAEELVRVLRSDDELVRLNQEARDRTRRDQDEEASQQIRREVARLLRLQGYAPVNATGASGNRRGDNGGTPPRPPRPPLPPIPAQEPPTYIRWVGDDERITIFPGQRRYLRIETDAPSQYYDVDPRRSRIQVMSVGADGLRVVGTAPLKNGRMRVALGCQEDCTIGETAHVRVELLRAGMPGLADERTVVVVERPPAPQRGRTTTMPPFEVIRVTRESDEWDSLGWPEQVSGVATEAVMSDGTLLIYYNAEFPVFATKLADYERRDTTLAGTFENRFKIWVAMHSLLLHQDLVDAAAGTTATDVASNTEARDEAAEQEERKRIASLAVMMASRELALEANLAAVD